MSKILVIDCNDIKEVHSTLADVFKYKHEEYGITLVPNKQNIIKLLEKTDAKVIICPELGKFNVAVQGKHDYFRTVYNEKDAALIRKYITEKNITVIPAIFNSFYTAFEKALSITIPAEYRFIIDVYALSYQKINVFSMNFVTQYKNHPSYILCTTKEDADMKINELVKEKIDNLKQTNISLQNSIKSNMMQIENLMKRLGKSL